LIVGRKYPLLNPLTIGEGMGRILTSALCAERRRNGINSLIRRGKMIGGNMYDIYGVPMPDRYEWIKTRAYYIWQARKSLGIWISAEEDWLDAEVDYTEAKEHNKRFHDNYDIVGEPKFKVSKYRGKSKC